jgi:hypothetical protein
MSGVPNVDNLFVIGFPGSLLDGAEVLVLPTVARARQAVPSVERRYLTPSGAQSPYAPFLKFLTVRKNVVVVWTDYKNPTGPVASSERTLNSCVPL